MPPPPTTQTILITGATRGLGRGLTAHYLAHPSTTVIACIRAPTSAAALSLHTLPTGPSSRLLLLPMDAASEPSVTAALATLPAHGIDALTLVIANAAAAGPVGRLEGVDAGAVAAAVVGTGLGPLWVWRGSVGMLRRGGGGKFVAVGSDMGSVGLVGQTGAVPLGAYGAGKAVVNYMVARVAVEERGVVGGYGGGEEVD
ncbi:hypothetical protein MMC13_001730 [Neofusicoccum parvum]|uniref:Uncharacterized protein n=1 Tax=Neofusicoccum parvum TaxID=310453 RepID=A0ACB5RZ48_9PEZI|nr:hypothetical protein MMC13_001730 [Neofusicoccum parvum]